MYHCGLEHDILSIYPYNGENIHEILCRLYSKIEQLKANGQVFDPEMIKEIEKKIMQLDKRVDKTIHSILAYKDLKVGEDWLPAINQALKDGNVVYFPAGEYCVTDTIRLKDHQMIFGDGINSKLKWCGGNDDRKAFILMGKNEVSALPNQRNDAIVVRDLTLDGDNRVGFGIYGTYLDFECEVDNIMITNTTAYGMYVARSWYCKYTNISAVKVRGCGLAFGMPLYHTNGDLINWALATPDALNMNNNLIQNVRGNICGSDGKFNEETRPMWGYALGFGRGNSFNVTGYHAEQTDGVGVYIYRGIENVMNLKNGYVEKNGISSLKEKRASHRIPFYFDIHSVNARQIKVTDVYIDENEDKVPQLAFVLKASERIWNGTITLENISYGNQIVIKDSFNNKNVFHVKNCWWSIGAGIDSLNNGIPVAVCSGTIKIPQNTGVSEQLKIPISYNKFSRRKLYVWTDNPHPVVAGQVQVFYYPGSPDSGAFGYPQATRPTPPGGNAPCKWKKLPNMPKAFTLYEVTDLSQFTDFMILADDVTRDTSFNFVVFEYTGDKTTYDDMDKTY